MGAWACRHGLHRCVEGKQTEARVCDCVCLCVEKRNESPPNDATECVCVCVSRVLRVFHAHAPMSPHLPAPLHVSTGASDNVLRQYFVERCRANLHFVLVVEGEPAALQRKVVAFPKVFQRVTVNAVDEWDEEARMHVSARQCRAVPPSACGHLLKISRGAYLLLCKCVRSMFHHPNPNACLNRSPSASSSARSNWRWSPRRGAECCAAPWTCMGRSSRT